MEKSSKNKQKIGCLIPCFRGGSVTLAVIQKALHFTDYIVLIDDACPNYTGQRVEKKFNSSDKVKVLFNSQNQGVGKSCRDGIKFLLENACTIIVKIDADGQIDPILIPALINPIIEGKAEAVKGNRFTSIDDLLSMPKIRIIGNLGLSFLNKISTGYWELFDPTNGFIAFKSCTQAVRLEKTDNRYFLNQIFFSMCISTNYILTTPHASIYANEISSLGPAERFQVCKEASN